MVAAFEKDEMDRSLRFPVLIRSGKLDDRGDRFGDPALKQFALDLIDVGRTVAHLDDRPTSQRIFDAIVRCGNQRSREVEPVVQIIVLHIDIDANEVRILVR